MMKNKISLNRNRDSDGTAREPLLGDESPVNFADSWTHTPKYNKYFKLANQADSPRRFEDRDVMGVQERMLWGQEEQLLAIGGTLGNLKTVSRQINLELDEQSEMLGDLSTELENADSKLDSTVKKVAKVLHMNDDRRQWLAIGVLTGLVILIIILFALIEPK